MNGSNKAGRNVRSTFHLHMGQEQRRSGKERFKRGLYSREIEVLKSHKGLTLVESQSKGKNPIWSAVPFWKDICELGSAGTSHLFDCLLL